MKKTLIFIIICCISQFGLAQKPKLTDKEKVEYGVWKEVVRLAEKKSDTTIINDYIKRNPPSSAYMSTWYTGSKSNLIAKLYWKGKKNKTISLVQAEKMKKDVISLMQQGIDSCLYCSLNGRYYRSIFLEENRDLGKVYQNDMKVLRASGFKETCEGIDVSIYTAYSESGAWAGFNFSPFRHIVPYMNMESLDKDGQLLSKMRVKPKGYSAFPFSYQYNFANQIHDFSISLFQIEAPVYFNFTKFGNWQNTKQQTNAFYYRPEIGFGSTYFTVNYGYNVQLNKKEQSSIDKHIFTARLSLLAFNKYFSKKKK